ncbi:MAG: hypothetical protein PHS97_07415, partial [Oscillospiraceae bacterium]|nr:hypothetical protein [Oscillospiraceae bacterium]
HSGQFKPTSSFLDRKTAYHFQGKRVADRRQLVTECQLSVARVRAAAAQYDATVTAYLAALLLVSIRETIPAKARNRTVRLAVPVNLRGFFSSQTMRNFFSLIEVTYDFRGEGGSLEAVVSEVKSALERELTQENLGGQITQQVRISSALSIRVIPLALKIPLIQLFHRVSDRRYTMVFSNVGQMKFPAAADSRIAHCGAFLSSSTRQLVTCSYRDRMVLAFSGTLLDKSVERTMIGKLRACDPALIVSTNYGAEVQGT